VVRGSRRRASRASDAAEVEEAAAVPGDERRQVNGAHERARGADRGVCLAASSPWPSSAIQKREGDARTAREEERRRDVHVQPATVVAVLSPRFRLLSRRSAASRRAQLSALAAGGSNARCGNRHRKLGAHYFDEGFFT
jgi:hypothetical protein